MTQRHTFVLNNGNEAILYAQTSPDMLWALVSDLADMKNACEIAAKIREKGLRVYSETEIKNSKG